VLVALLACPGWADIINGSFETGDFTGWHVDEVLGFAQVVPGGTDGVSMGQLTCEGTYSVNDPDLFVPALVAVWQSVDVQAGDSWLLFDAWVDGNVTLQAVIPWGEWVEVTVTCATPSTYALPVWQAQGNSINVDFRARDYDIGTNVAYVDNVRLTGVPEPAGSAMVAVGLSGVLGLRCWRRGR